MTLNFRRDLFPSRLVQLYFCYTSIPLNTCLCFRDNPWVFIHASVKYETHKPMFLCAICTYSHVIFEQIVLPGNRFRSTCIVLTHVLNRESSNFPAPSRSECISYTRCSNLSIAITALRAKSTLHWVFAVKTNFCMPFYLPTPRDICATLSTRRSLYTIRYEPFSIDLFDIPSVILSLLRGSGTLCKTGSTS